MQDDYYGVMSDASDYFEKIFPVDENILVIAVVAIKKSYDEYGNDKYSKISETIMKRETYNKINWNHFEYAKLDEITDVNFLGESFVKDLEDLEKELNAQQAMYDDMVRYYY